MTDTDDAERFSRQGPVVVGESGSDVLGDACGVAAGGVGPADLLPGEEGGVEVIESDRGGGDEFDGAVRKKRGVADGAGPGDQSVGIAEVRGGNFSAGKINDFSEWFERAAQEWNFIIGDNFHG